MTGPKIYFCFFCFYPVSLPYCRLLKDIVEYHDKTPHSVTVVTCGEDSAHPSLFGDDAEFIYAPKLLSKFGKLVTYLLFPVFCMYVAIRAPAGSVFFIPSTPPVIMGVLIAFAQRLRRKKISFIYHCQDIHPEAMVLSGQLSYGHVLRKVLTKLENFSIAESASTIVLSQDMRDTVSTRMHGKHVGKLSVINNHANIDTLTSSDTHNTWSVGQPIKVLYGGNIGRFQNLAQVVKYFLTQEAIRFDIYGKGQERGEVELAASPIDVVSNVSIYEPLPLEEINKIVSHYDFGLVTLVTGMLGVAYPSKIIWYLSQGIPIILIGDEDSSLGSEIEAEGIGVFIPIEKIQGHDEDDGYYLSAKLVEFLQTFDRSNILKYMEKSFKKEDCLSAIGQLTDKALG